MNMVDIFEVGIVIIGLIGVVDYSLFKRREYGKNYPKLFQWRK